MDCWNALHAVVTVADHEVHVIGTMYMYSKNIVYIQCSSLVLGVLLLYVISRVCSTLATGEGLRMGLGGVDNLAVVIDCKCNAHGNGLGSTALYKVTSVCSR